MKSVYGLVYGILSLGARMCKSALFIKPINMGRSHPKLERIILSLKRLLNNSTTMEVKMVDLKIIVVMEVLIKAQAAMEAHKTMQVMMMVQKVMKGTTEAQKAKKDKLLMEGMIVGQMLMEAMIMVQRPMKANMVKIMENESIFTK
ncbi:unnamed protein product [Ranitomeya imitator]|uniref:Uncharacterized protein n=1 Tax=Ranitomeya imitator TaxID=111125 RepID=A0ABN9L4A1_9NEOB|nr:unnamed protein product [Ranitomeya imitator]